jgi:hypothetical protein
MPARAKDRYDYLTLHDNAADFRQIVMLGSVDIS